MSGPIIISNGHGEDMIGNALARVFKNSRAIALIGPGLHYTAIPCMAPFPILPSGGFLRSVRAIWGDLRAGLLSQLYRQHRFLKRELAGQSPVIIVGDVACVIQVYLAYTGPRYCLATAKSHRFMHHSWLERRILATCCRQVFTRDSQTAQDLKKQGVNATYAGSFLKLLDPPQEILPDGQYIGLLPGSRAEAVANFKKLCQLIPQNRSYLMAVSPGDTARFTPLLPPHITLCAFSTVLAHSGVIIGLAGTANEQAVAYNRTVITCRGTGTQTTLQRLQEQRALLGDRLVVVPDTPAAIAQAIQTHWRPPEPIQWHQSDTMARIHAAITCDSAY